MSRTSGLRGAPASMGHSAPLVPPLQPSVVYTTDGPDTLDRIYEGGADGFSYSREGHPNAQSLARRIADLEGAAHGLVTGSGMSATAVALLGVLKAGDHIVAGNQLYGRTLRLLTENLPALGITSTQADPTDADAMARAIGPETRAILVEVVSNPTIRVADMEAIAALAGDRGLCLIVDNTFTTPRAYRPLAAGADIVIHSVTKLLAGHSDALLGFVGTGDAALAERIDTGAQTWGLTASPFDCWLAERGLLTFEVRYDRGAATAAALADALAAHGAVERVLYPGRPDHPDAARARTLFGPAQGNMVSFDLGGDRGRAQAFVTAARDIAFAPTLGDVATTLSHAASSSHRGLSVEGRAALGIGEGFFRVSVGLEDGETLIDAFINALNAL